MSSFPDAVVDEDGNIHHLIKEPLGRGGQGVVLRTRSPHIAVKLIGNIAENSSRAASAKGVTQKLWSQLTHATGISMAQDREEQAAFRRRLEDVRLLPLPDLHVAQPLAMLRDHVGYTMRLLKDTVPIRSLIAEPGERNLATFYHSTGGLRRRMELLANAAGILARIHSVPLVYADISPNNIFVSEHVDDNEVWLIDLDNLDYLSANATGIFTLGFGAPEVVTGRAGVSTLSDSYAFAVLAFWVLAQIHPFLGDFVEKGGWDDEGDEDREELAFRGEFPWVEDTQDDSNHTSKGIPRHLVLSKPVRELFQRAFEGGRMDRTQRPSMTEWAEVLRRAADRIVSCVGCESSFDVTAGNCPFCPERPRPSFIHMQVNRWDPDIDDVSASAVSSRPVWHKMLDATKESVVLRHVVEPVLADAEDPPVLRIRILRSGIAIEPLSGHEIHVMFGERIQRIDREVKLPMPKAGNEIYLHFGALNRPHRMAVLRLVEGA
jgi:serine/threonine protein kinase